MKRIAYTLATLLLSALLFACANENEFHIPGYEKPEEETPSTDNSQYPNTEWAAGTLAEVFDMGNLPEIHIEVPLDEWNTLLQEYDNDNNTGAYIHCDVEYNS